MNDRFGLRNLIRNDTRLAGFYRCIDAKDHAAPNFVPCWLEDGISFCYIAETSHGASILRVDGVTGKTTALFDAQRMHAAIGQCLGRTVSSCGFTLENLRTASADSYLVTVEGRDCVLSTRTYEVAPAPSTGSAKDGKRPRLFRRPMWLIEPMLVAEVESPDRSQFASLQDNNLVVRAAGDDRASPVTLDGVPEFGWDLAAPWPKPANAPNAERSDCCPWSFDSGHLFAAKFDRSLVPRLPLIRYLDYANPVSWLRVQQAGRPLDIGHPHVIDVRTKAVRRFELGDTADHYFTLVGWLPNDREVFFTRHSRDFKKVDLLAGDAATGSVRVIFSEQASTFVAIQHEVIFHGNNHATILADGAGLIWRSGRSGWNHFYYYSVDGMKAWAITEGNFPVIDLAGFDPASRWVYFTAHYDQLRPYDIHLCRIKLTGGQIQQLTPLDGHNVVSLAPSFRGFVVSNSRPDRPFRADFHEIDGPRLCPVQAQAASDESTLAEEFTVTAADGETVLWGVIYKPLNFDPRLKYPIIDHLYGGPQAAIVAHHYGLSTYSHARLDRALTQLGYIVIALDARGTPERSKAFHDVVYGNWGRHEIPDHVAAIHQLAGRFPFLDLTRVGVFGHSWGGYFATRALAQAPNVFHVGVASAPAYDPYDAILYEPYLNLPSRAPGAYDYAKLYHWASRITGKLMIAVGSADPKNHADVMEMVHALIEVGVDHELVVLPDGGHGFHGRNDEYFLYKLVRHFETHLKRRFPLNRAASAAAGGV